MAFWGVEVKPGKPFVHSCKKRIRITQATVGSGTATEKCLVQCNIGRRSPVFLCSLLPNTTESCNLNLEFEEEEDVIFSVIGPRSVYLIGHYVHHYRNNEPSNFNSDDPSQGIDIENTESEKSSEDAEDEKYEDSFINDSESPKPSPISCRRGDKKLKDKKQRHKQLKKKNRVIMSDDDLEVQETEDEDGYSLSAFIKKKPMKAMVKEENNISYKSEGGALDCDMKEKKDHDQEGKKDEREVTPQKIDPQEGEAAIKEDVSSDFKTLEHNALENDVEQDLPIDKNEDKIYDQHWSEHGCEPKKINEDMDIAATSGNRLETSDKMETTMEKDLPVGAPNHDEQMVEADGNEKPLEVKTLSNGLVVEVLAKGDPNGKAARLGKKVKVNITGMLKENGHIIESNVGKSPVKYTLGKEEVIDGLNMGIDGMRVGEKRRITIPPSLGFGEDGYGEKVPPNSWLVYNVELVGVRR
ncbi:FKBP-type peptidyl-prolyl cis-trans isomerase [Handroanthus impetiginosus]|uniref:peptidylprolyl isomerase n=1 Tax=Handroanthus impetiginosus TaxID=429701 RepID=A0A2G9I6D4_9LAMI|nr:FKBP-type peptidyl-prolyl cis-trans isomerase [Handroanthus impetiginosus]